VWRHKIKVIRKVVSILDTGYNRVVDILAGFTGVLVVFMVLSVSADVILRSTISRPIVWVNEGTEYALLYITFLGAAWLLRREGHVRVDIVLNRLEPRTQAILNAVTSVILATICFLLVWYGTRVTLDNFERGILSVRYYEPPKFIFLAVIPLGSLLLFIESMKKTFGFIQSIRKKGREVTVGAAESFQL